MTHAMMDRLVASPCSNPELNLEDALAAYADLGFTCFEAFSSWACSALDWTGDPYRYRQLAAEHGMRFTSFHLPPVDDDIALSVGRAVDAARFAQALGAEVVLYKATSRENYIRGAKPYLDATDSLDLVPVLQNHAGSPISTLADFREVIDGINDSRMKTLLEVGHFHSVGVSWREGYDLLGDSIALVHIKDQIGARSVPFGEGEIDLPGLFAHMRDVGYHGRYVVEMEVEDRENTLSYLRDASEYLREHCWE